jgi:hypothetical protein
MQSPASKIYKILKILKSLLARRLYNEIGFVSVYETKRKSDILLISVNLELRTLMYSHLRFYSKEEGFRVLRHTIT